MREDVNKTRVAYPIKVEASMDLKELFNDVHTLNKNKTLKKKIGRIKRNIKYISSINNRK